MIHHLSKSQKDALYHVANVVMTAVVHGGEKAAEAWKNASSEIDHKATVRVFTRKGLLADGILTAEGIQAAKDVWAETFADKGVTWDQETTAARKRKKKHDETVQRRYDEWNAYLSTLPVPDGYRPAAGAPYHVEWKPEEFAYAPTIQIHDKNTPYMGEGRYKSAEWEMGFSTGSGMDAEAVRLFKEALDIAQTTMIALEARHADDPVVSL